MSIESSANLLLPEVTVPKDKQPAAGVDDGSLADEKSKVKAKPKPGEPDPQEVQYPGYVEGGGSL